MARECDDYGCCVLKRELTCDRCGERFTHATGGGGRGAHKHRKYELDVSSEGLGEMRQVSEELATLVGRVQRLRGENAALREERDGRDREAGKARAAAEKLQAEVAALRESLREREAELEEAREVVRHYERMPGVIMRHLSVGPRGAWAGWVVEGKSGDGGGSGGGGQQPVGDVNTAQAKSASERSKKSK